MPKPPKPESMTPDDVPHGAILVLQHQIGPLKKEWEQAKEKALLAAKAAKEAAGTAFYVECQLRDASEFLDFATEAYPDHSYAEEYKLPPESDWQARNRARYMGRMEGAQEPPPDDGYAALEGRFQTLFDAVMENIPVSEMPLSVFSAMLNSVFILHGGDVGQALDQALRTARKDYDDATG